MRISKYHVWIVIGVLLAIGVSTTAVLLLLPEDAEESRFPSTFKFGTASAAYQIEGAWNEDGKGPNVWDDLTHNHPELIADRSNGDVGPDSYHKYKEDVKAMKAIGMQFYRFSVGWSRVLPNGDLSSKNELGLAYYDRLIDELVANDIEPMITMYHWDLPSELQKLGGMLNPLIVDYFEQYARLLFQRYGDRVKSWITFNEPTEFCGKGHGWGTTAPLIRLPGVGDYLCAHHTLLSHARVYHMYRAEFYAAQQGKVGITLNSGFYYPKDPNNGDDRRAADRVIQFNLGLYAHPIFSTAGGYPGIVELVVSNNSMLEGRPWSRLPKMDEATRDLIRGSADFMGLNYYTSRMCEFFHTPWEPSFNNDVYVWETVDDSWPRAKSEWLYSVPKGLGDLLRWIKNEYKNPEVVITENGWSDDGEEDDSGRITYLKSHLREVAEAIKEDGCNVTGHTTWSIIDNFEWLQGYAEKFGIYRVNVSSVDKDRVAKKSVDLLKQIIANREVPA